MTPAPAHLGEELHDLLDRRLDAAAQARAEAHLAGCAECRRELEALRVAKDALAGRGNAIPLPPELASAVSRALDGEGAAGPAPAPNRRPLFLRPALVVSFLVLLALGFATVLWRARYAPDVASTVGTAYADYRAGRLPLELRTTDTAEMERFFSAHGVPFPTHVYDLGMMGFRLVGGRVHVLDARTSALFAYQGADGAALLCDMYLGRLEELPDPVETREHDGIRFDVHRKDGMTMVFWEEGDVICVLVSEMPAEDLIKLAFAKAMKPRAAELQSP
jgi:anti-sigma factor RsiW